MSLCLAIIKHWPIFMCSFNKTLDSMKLGRCFIKTNNYYQVYNANSGKILCLLY